MLFLFAFRVVRLLLSGHQAVAIENVALRMQIAAFRRERKRPLLTTLDRLFWVSLRCPFPREVLKAGKIVAIPQLGSLHHWYERIAA